MKRVRISMETTYRRRGAVDCRFPDAGAFLGELQYFPRKGVGVALYQDGSPVVKIWQRKEKPPIWDAVSKFCISFTSFSYLSPPYGVWAGEREIGKSVSCSWREGFLFEIRGSVYALREHSHNVGSLTKNGRQIARFAWQRNPAVTIDCKGENDELLLILAFAMLFYAVFHANEYGWHTTILFRDKYKELAQWSAEDEERV